MSYILSTATRYLLPLMMLYSLFVLLRGHNNPGGGFIGGLVAAAAFALYSIAHDVKSARICLRVRPQVLIGVGLLVAVVAGLPAVLSGEGTFLTGMWTGVGIPVAGKFGTPLLFDVGVYLVVLGVATLIVFSLAEE